MNAPLEELKLSNREVIALLTSMVWADERMAWPQVRAVAASAELLRHPDPVRKVAAGPAAYDPLLLREASVPARAMVYAMAAFVAAADRRRHPREVVMLEALQRELDIDTPTALVLDALARDMSTRPITSWTILELLYEAALRSVDAHSSGS